MQKAAFNLVNKLQTDLKQYSKILKDGQKQLPVLIANLPEQDKEFFVNLQNEISKAIATGDAKKAMAKRDELMNYIQQNGENHTSNEP